MGDIGSHAENLAATITGRHVTQRRAPTSRPSSPGRLLDDDAAVLLRLDGGVRGLLVASQIETGNENNLRIRVHGSEGSLHWRQEDPNLLVHAPATARAGYLRRGNDYLSECGAEGHAHPAGPPGGLPRGVRQRLPRRRSRRSARSRQGRELGPLEGQFPTVEDGARGVRFIERVIESGASDRKWVDI